ncbi:MAG: pyridoxal-dependent decarboxylase [Acidimicrobiales bacterium]|nr:pyridoxal-dependent decarboxylase [Acidimicrobiales bacterium]MDG1489246.1 pyridoxal-dependent decarboxylase [Actinomycetota bacterium]MDG1846601.1 pyridoxal-dependent decarboxylase [Acidimicrobiales bacterium]
MSTPEPFPHLSSEEFRKYGYQLVDWLAEYFSGIDEMKVIPDVEPGEIRSMLPEQAPETAEDMEDIIADLDRVVMPGMAHWQHPGWFAFFPSGVSPVSVLGEFVAAGLATQGMMWSTAPAATEIENTVLDWLVELLGLPSSWRLDTGPGGGVLQMSASDSTHLSLAVARYHSSEAGHPTDSLVAYGSSQAHSSIEKGARIAGFRHIRSVPVDTFFSLDVDALQQQIDLDLAEGLIPTWVCSAVGTTSTTAMDPIRPIAAIAKKYGMWHHADAAYAGSAMICPEFRELQDGVELVDSYTFNPHKWLLTNFDCSVFWVADRSKLINALSILPAYLKNESSENPSAVDYRDWHVPLGRRFRALKLWFVLRSYGAENLRSFVRSHVDWAKDLEGRLMTDPRFEIVAPRTLALVCFRHVGGNEATKQLAKAVNASGTSYLTPSVIEGTDFIRVSIGSTWTERRHIEALWDLFDENAVAV